MGVRLTDVERAERKVSGGALQSQITDYAELLGWQWCHWRPLLNRRGFYQVPVEGPLGKGWPDLTLVRARDRRLIFAELKRQIDDPLTPDQEHVLDTLRSIEFDASCGSGPHIDVARYPRSTDGLRAWWEAGRPETRHDCCPPLIEVHVWRPSDLRDPIDESVIGRILR